MVVSNIFYVHPYLGKIPILTNFFFKGVETTNQIFILFQSNYWGDAGNLTGPPISRVLHETPEAASIATEGRRRDLSVNEIPGCKFWTCAIFASMQIMNIWIYLCIYVHVCRYVGMHICTHVCLHVSTWVYMYISMSMPISMICIYIYIHLFRYVNQMHPLYLFLCINNDTGSYNFWHVYCVFIPFWFCCSGGSPGNTYLDPREWLQQGAGPLVTAEMLCTLMYVYIYIFIYIYIYMYIYI